MATCITREQVIEQAAELPGFPRVINEILATIDDPEANLNVLAQLIKLDPAIAARVLSLANVAASRVRSQADIRDIYTAASLIGIGRVRQMTLVSCCMDFFHRMVSSGAGKMFSQHSIAVGICAEELALHVSKPVSASLALIAGLLHDIGQLWLLRFDPQGSGETWEQAFSRNEGIEDAERERFGIDHSDIGAWLAEHWQLPPAITTAIRHHHACEADLSQPIVPLLHVAEVLANALDLTGRKENRVTRISAAACRSLGIEWTREIHPLFGRIEARTRHVNTFFA